MNAFRSDINAWLKSHPHVTVGRTFPFGDYSCTPLLCDADDCEAAGKLTGFLLSRGKYIELVEPDGPNHNLWEPLLLEMECWHTQADAGGDTPPECWYG